MNGTVEYSKIINKLTKFRTISRESVECQIKLVKKILDSAQVVFDKNVQNLTPEEQGRLDFYNEVLDEVKQSIDAVGLYNQSLEDDYAEAMSLLSKLQGGNKNG